MIVGCVNIQKLVIIVESSLHFICSLREFWYTDLSILLFVVILSYFTTSCLHLLEDDLCEILKGLYFGCHETTQAISRNRPLRGLFK